MAKKGIRVDALTDRVKSIYFYIQSNQGYINNVTKDTAPLIYKELKSILLLGNVYKPKPKVKIPAQFVPIKQYEEDETY